MECELVTMGKQTGRSSYALCGHIHSGEWVLRDSPIAVYNETGTVLGGVMAKSDVVWRSHV